MNDISLAKFQHDQIERLATWLQAEHVRRWFPHADDVLSWARSVPENGRQRLIVNDDQAIGYIRWTYVSRDELDSVGFEDIPANSADIDLLIGARSNTGRGAGRRALELALAELRAEGIAKLAALTTSIDNRKAHKAFADVGFKIDREYSPGEFGRCYLMVRDV